MQPHAGRALLPPELQDEILHRLHVQELALLITDDREFLLAARTVTLVGGNRNHLNPALQMRGQLDATQVLAICLGNAGLASRRISRHPLGLPLDFFGRHAGFAIQEDELPVAQFFALGSELLEMEQTDHLPQNAVFAREPLLLRTLGGEGRGNGIAQVGRELLEIESHARL